MKKGTRGAMVQARTTPAGELSFDDLAVPSSGADLAIYLVYTK